MAHGVRLEDISLDVLFIFDPEDEPEVKVAGQAGLDDSELAKQTQNPLASLISLPFQNNTNFDLGEFDRTQNVLNIQPILPFTLSEDWNLINRVIVPVIDQPDITRNSTGVWGLGAINWTAWLSPADSGAWIWGAGPILVFPTATDEVLGSDKWSAGPSVVVLTMPGDWVVGALVNNVWSFAGTDSRESVNFLTTQYFVNYNLGNGLYLASAPIITADWTADSADRWTIPFGAGIGKVFKIGKQPINTSIHAYYNVRRPTDGPRWTLRIQIQFLFPK